MSRSPDHPTCWSAQLASQASNHFKAYKEPSLSVGDHFNSLCLHSLLHRIHRKNSLSEATTKLPTSKMVRTITMRLRSQLTSNRRTPVYHRTGRFATPIQRTCHTTSTPRHTSLGGNLLRMQTPRNSRFIWPSTTPRHLRETSEPPAKGRSEQPIYSSNIVTVDGLQVGEKPTLRDQRMRLSTQVPPP